MKVFKVFSLLAAPFLFFLSFAAEARSHDVVQSLVNQYYTQQVRLFDEPHLPPPPGPPGSGPVPAPSPAPPARPAPRPNPPNDCGGGGNTGACVEAVCKQMSRFECDDRRDMEEVTNACRNVSGSCVTNICSRVSRFACDEKVEVFEVTNMCRGLLDIKCIDYVCSRLSRWDCDEISELKEIARQCR